MIGPKSPQAPPRPTASPWRQTLVERVQAFIAANIDDHQLGPTTIARTHFISTRYLHKLFENEGVSVCEHIRLERLALCRRDLSDPSLAHESVFAIAARWGFVSAPHFSRSFRMVYGNSPREFRKKNFQTC